MDHEQKNDKTEKSNDSPEIPDRRVTSDIPGLPSELAKTQHKKLKTQCEVTLIFILQHKF